MIIGRKLRYVFAAVQKAGSMTCRNWLVAHYQGERISFYHDFDVPDEFAGFFRFISVRNPYERMFSLWAYLTEKAARMDAPEGHEEAWAAACQGIIPLCECYYRQGFTQSQIFDRVGASMALRLEDINEEVKRLPFYRPGTPDPQHRRKTPNKPARSFFDVHSRDSDEARTIRDLYGEDFDRFGYAR